VWAFVVVLAVILVLLVLLRGSPELARFEVRDGRLSFLRGRLPPRLFEDFADVLSRRSIERADVRIVLDGGRPRVVATGVTDDELQQLRNVAGSYTSSQFRTGRAPRQYRQ
jgi:uncharacterized protein DUF3634